MTQNKKNLLVRVLVTQYNPCTSNATVSDHLSFYIQIFSDPCTKTEVIHFVVDVNMGTETSKIL